MLKILPFIRIVCLKQQSSILRCFCRSKFEKSLFSNTFFKSIFRGKMIVHAAEKDQIKYLAQKLLGKIAFFYVQTAAWHSCCCHKLLFHHIGNCRAFKRITIWTTTTPDRIHYLNIRKRKPCWLSIKTLNILNIESWPWYVPPPTFTNHLTTWAKPSSKNNKYITFSGKLNASWKWNLDQTS